MVVRKAKKTKKYLGTRTRGAGNTKNRRGGGNRGGRGRAGAFAHKFVKYLNEEKDYKLKPKKKELAVSLRYINAYVENLLIKGKIKKAELEKGYEIDFDKHKDFKKYSKVIGRTEPKYKLILKNVKATEKVKELIKRSGGKLE